ncbi:OLC1v1027708C1 [Oldenlandia corymbosa var. corymbosa]|uniref:OLC1v1027708C1 n=1 Tax=Oldenlandia corymbosa var. corymbosa TaxID=529605 RepID=A0AAV1CBY8_OLDCO|nr:OLC1v1027708C1 [Oldenlandia corymbosa var. corymbosa]
MVLSNKKLKQKLRAEKAELLAAAESLIGKNSEDPNSGSQPSLEPVDSVPRKPKLSKREKRREKGPSLQENNGKLNGIGRADEKPENAGEGSEEVVTDAKKSKKRKRGEGDQKLDDGKSEEVKKSNKKKKKKKKKKQKKNKKKEEEKVDNGKVKDGILSFDDAKNDGQGVAETATTANSEQSVDVSAKVYVGGIPYYSSEDDIRHYFEDCGTITEIDCMKFPETGKFRGIAILNFKVEAAAKRALALDGSDMGGFFLKIQPYKPSKPAKTANFSPTIVEGYNRIYVGNLSWDITEEDLKTFFSGCSIASIRFGKDKETEEFRGYAHVDFSDSHSLSRALQLDQQIVCGRPARISCAVPKKGSDKKTKSVPESNEPAGDVVSVPESKEPAAADVVTAISGKIRRRTCYECGEKGHLSSACPKKQAVDQTDAATSLTTGEQSWSSLLGLNLMLKGNFIFHSWGIDQGEIMAVYSRCSTDQLLMPSKWNIERSESAQSPESTMFWSEQPPNKFSNSVGSVPVVYYLSRNGQLDHPHFIQVPLSGSHGGLFLKDVVNKLNSIRGNGMAYMYSWSSKRSYKNGYVWQDLTEGDLIHPTNDHDYILKGSEILKGSRLLPQTTTIEAYDYSSNHHRSSKSRKKNQSWSTFEIPTNPSSKNNSIYECRLVRKSESSRELGGGRASADMATQTEAAVDMRRRSKSMRVYVNKSVESSREEELSNLSPPSMTSSEGCVSGSGDVDQCAGVMDPTVQNEYTSGTRIKPSRVLMHLISCGSTAKDLGPVKESPRGYSVKARCGRTVLRDVVDR